MGDDTAASLGERFSFLSGRDSADHWAYNCPAGEFYGFCRALKEEFGFDMLIDVTAVDWDADRPRFTGIYHFLSTGKHEYLRVAVDCENDHEPTLPSLTPLYPAANWHERETFDLLGVRFEGHPNLTRILMWEGYPYHPLRKEFPLAGIEVPLPAADVTESTGAKVTAAPMMGGPFVSPGEGTMSHDEPRARDESWTEKRPKPDKDGSK